MPPEIGKFTVTFSELSRPTFSAQTEGIFIGRLDSCEVVLDHTSISRIHAGINFRRGRYLLINLSTSNKLTLNGRLIEPKNGDVLADGDTIQVGPFTISVGIVAPDIILMVESAVSMSVAEPPAAAAAALRIPPQKATGAEGVLKVFWEKRSREKEQWGTRLRPSEKPRPGKAMYNWRPTGDLRQQWRFGLFVWSFLLVAALGAYAYFQYPQTYAPEPLSYSHAAVFENTTIAATSNASSCVTCHAPNEPLENSCVKCHQGSEFHATNTKAHQDAGVTCTVCHQEHKGPDFKAKAASIESCAQCHNDANAATYNGKSVKTPHGGTVGYPIVDGVWKWKGVYNEVAAAIPEINSSATGDKDEQARLSRQFHTIHVGRLKSPPGLPADKKGLVSCSTCHAAFDPIDRTTPRAACASCHTSAVGTGERDARFAAGGVNCISCHVQHPYSGGRWSEFLTADAHERRRQAVINKIAELGAK